MNPIQISYRDIQRNSPLFKKLLAQGATMEVHNKKGFLFYITQELSGSSEIADSVVSKIKSEFNF